MASKKKAKAGARKAKASARKTKSGTRKVKAEARNAKAGASKKKAGAARKKPAAAKKKPATVKAKPRKRAPVTVAKAKPPAAERPSGPIIIDEVIEESLIDVSTVLRIKDGVARSRRDVDEDELRQFPDPSLVVEAQTINPRDDDTDPSISQLPDLFAAEARRQKERLGDRPADAPQKPRESSLFGSIGGGGNDDDDDDEV